MSSNEFYGGDVHLLYSAEDSRRVDDLFTVHKVFLMLAGQTPKLFRSCLPPAFQWIGYKLACCYSACVFVLHVHLAVLLMKSTYDGFVHGNLSEISDVATNTLMYSNCVFNMLYWLWNEEIITNLMHDINSKYRHHSMAGLTYVNGYKPYYRAKIITIIYNVSATLGVTGVSLVPIITKSDRFPMNVHYPFEVPTSSVTYKVIYVLHFVAQWTMGFNYAVTAGLFLSIVFVMLAQFDILYCSLKNLYHHALILMNRHPNELQQLQNQLPAKEDDELNQYVFLEEQPISLSAFETISLLQSGSQRTLKECMQQALKECIKIHRFIAQTCYTLEEFYNIYCLTVSLQITVQLCLLVFLVFDDSQTLFAICTQMLYFTLTLLDLVFYTYPGELIRQHSTRCGEAFWRSPWREYAGIIRQDILIMLINGQRNIRFTAGKFFTLDVLRFRLVVTQAFSFFTLMKSISRKSK